MESLELGASTASSLTVKTKVNITNPTPYSAFVPFVDFRLLYNETKVAHITGRDLSVFPGINHGMPIDLQWSPLDLGGTDGVTAGRELISQYISGEKNDPSCRPPSNQCIRRQH